MNDCDGVMCGTFVCVCVCVILEKVVIEQVRHGKSMSHLSPYCAVMLLEHNLWYCVRVCSHLVFFCVCLSAQNAMGGGCSVIGLILLYSVTD